MPDERGDALAEVTPGVTGRKAAPLPVVVRGGRSRWSTTTCSGRLTSTERILAVGIAVGLIALAGYALVYADGSVLARVLSVLAPVVE